MNYYEMTTEQLESLKSSVEEKIDGYVSMSFPSLRSELVTYEVDSVDSVMMNQAICLSNLRILNLLSF